MFGRSRDDEPGDGGRVGFANSSAALRAPGSLGSALFPCSRFEGGLLVWSFVYLVVRNLFALVWLLARPRRSGPRQRPRRMTGFPLLAGAPRDSHAGDFFVCRLFPRYSIQRMPSGQQTCLLRTVDSVYRGNARRRFAGTLRDGSDGTRTRDLRRDRPTVVDGRPRFTDLWVPKTRAPGPRLATCDAVVAGATGP